MSMPSEQSNQTVSRYLKLVKWIESNVDEEIQEVFEGELGYFNKHHLAKVIIKFSPNVTKRRDG